jgi:hypothetical protein
MSPPVRVLFLAGSGRSGSTLVTTILGQLDGFFAAGELRYFWQRGLVDNRPCGCGLPLRECPVWTGIGADLPPIPPADIAAHLRTRLRLKRLPALLRRRAVAPHRDDTAIAALYSAIASLAPSLAPSPEGGADSPARDGGGGVIIVDSSKLPPYGVLVGGLPGVEMRVLHVVRDPRAAAFSWRRKRALDGAADARQMTRHPVWKAAALWAVWNAATIRLWARRAPGGYLRVRYEDLVAAPAETIRRIAEFAGAAPDTALPFTADGLVTLGTTHSVAGNPSRHRVGGVAVKADDEWRRSLPRRSHALVTALTAPLLLGLGYRLGRRTR